MSNDILGYYNCLILEKANALQFEFGLGTEYWNEACRVAIYLRNKSLISKRAMFLYESWIENKPNIIHSCIWDCPPYIYISKEKYTKLNHQSEERIFIGYHSDSMCIYQI